MSEGYRGHKSVRTTLAAWFASCHLGRHIRPCGCRVGVKDFAAIGAETSGLSSPADDGGTTRARAAVTLSGEELTAFGRPVLPSC